APFAPSAKFGLVRPKLRFGRSPLLWWFAEEAGGWVGRAGCIATGERWPPPIPVVPHDQWPCGLGPPRVMTSTTSTNVIAGHAEMHRATSDGSAASTLATTEATTPAQNASHADQRWRRPSPSAAVAVAIMPSTEIGSMSAISSDWPYAKATALRRDQLARGRAEPVQHRRVPQIGLRHPSLLRRSFGLVRPKLRFGPSRCCGCSAGEVRGELRPCRLGVAGWRRCPTAGQVRPG